MDLYIIYYKKLSVLLLCVFSLYLTAAAEPIRISFSSGKQQNENLFLIKYHNRSGNNIGVQFRISFTELTAKSSTEVSILTPIINIPTQYGETNLLPLIENQMAERQNDSLLFRILSLQQQEKFYQCIKIINAENGVEMHEICREIAPDNTKSEKTGKNLFRNMQGGFSAQYFAYPRTPYYSERSNSLLLALDNNLQTGPFPILFAAAYDNFPAYGNKSRLNFKLALDKNAFNNKIFDEYQSSLTDKQLIENAALSGKKRREEELERISQLLHLIDNQDNDSLKALSLPHNVEQKLRKRKTELEAVSTDSINSGSLQAKALSNNDMEKELRGNRNFSRSEKIISSIERLEIGSIHPFETELSHSGRQLNGGLVSLEPGALHLGFAAGNIRQIHTDTSFGHPLSIGKMHYMLAGPGRRMGSHFHIGYFKYSFPDDTDASPWQNHHFPENEVVNARSAWLSRKMRWTNEVAASRTLNYRSVAFENQHYTQSNGHLLRDIFQQKSSDSLRFMGYAYRSRLQSEGPNIRIPYSIDIQGISNTYHSAGNPFLPSGHHLIHGRISKYFWSQKLRLQAHARYMLKELKLSESGSFQAGVECVLRLPKIPDIAVGVIPSSIFRPNGNTFFGNQTKLNLSRQFLHKKTIYRFAAGLGRYSFSETDSRLNEYRLTAMMIARSGHSYRISGNISTSNDYNLYAFKQITAEYQLPYRKMQFMPGVQYMEIMDSKSFGISLKYMIFSNKSLFIETEALKLLNNSQEMHYIQEYFQIHIRQLW